MIRKQNFFSEDDYLLLRKSTYDFAQEICNYIDLNKIGSVLEIGPSSKLHKENSFPEFNTDIISIACEKNKTVYSTLDIDSNSEADFIGSIEDLSFLEGRKFDIVVLLSVLEHVENIFAVPEQLYNITKSGSLIFINTPFLFKVHGPTPDCWRISEFGYKALFKQFFSIKSLKSYPPDELGKNSFPLCYNVILERV